MILYRPITSREQKAPQYKPLAFGKVQKKEKYRFGELHSLAAAGINNTLLEVSKMKSHLSSYSLKENAAIFIEKKQESSRTYNGR